MLQGSSKHFMSIEPKKHHRHLHHSAASPMGSDLCLQFPLLNSKRVEGMSGAPMFVEVWQHLYSVHVRCVLAEGCSFILVGSRTSFTSTPRPLSAPRSFRCGGPTLLSAIGCGDAGASGVDVRSFEGGDGRIDQDGRGLGVCDMGDTCGPG